MERAGKRKSKAIPVRWQDQSAESDLALLSLTKVLFLLKKAVFRNKGHQSPPLSELPLSVDSILSLYIHLSSITSM